MKDKVRFQFTHRHTAAAHTAHVLVLYSKQITHIKETTPVSDSTLLTVLSTFVAVSASIYSHVICYILGVTCHGTRDYTVHLIS